MNFPNVFPTNFPTNFPNNFPNDIKMIVRKLLSNNHFRNINKEYHNIYVLNNDIICFSENRSAYAFNYRNILYLSHVGFLRIYHFQTPTKYYLPKNYR